jgi:acetyl-CoA carboxylase biotin carboxyl carrier protein
MQLTDEDVRAILQLLDASRFNELQLQTDTFRLTLRRSDSGEWTQQATVLSPATMLSPVAPQVNLAAAVQPIAPTASGHPGKLANDHQGLVEVRAPLLGTFYRSPKPGSAPFVQVGSQVHPDTVVAIVETMKLMNSVSAGTRGSIVEICLADAQFAEQDVVLMRIKPESP